MGVYVGEGVLVLVGSGVLVGMVVAVGGGRVDVGGVGGVGELLLNVIAAVTSMDTLKRMVRELVAVIFLAMKGRSFGTIGVYGSVTVTRTRCVLSDRI